MTASTATVAEQLGYRLMLAFNGTEVPAHVRTWLSARSTAGFTLFRALNVTTAGQVRQLTQALQQTVADLGQPPLLIAADQEGGQLMALGTETTPFPGNMALGASRDTDLVQRVGRAIGREMAALGVNVNYAPVSDVNSNHQNPNVGIRAFAGEPELVAKMAAAFIVGQQAAGVAATAKHFPGSGDAGVDPHFGLPVLPQDPTQLEATAFRPFHAAIDAGVKLVMSGHIAIPALTGRSDLPATVQRELMHDLLRQDMGFQGLSISDAMDMAAISQGAGQIVDAIAALRAGVDVLLLTADHEVQERLYQGLQLALSRGLLTATHVLVAVERILNLKYWLSQQTQPPLDVVGCWEHRQLAQELAERSVTLVRDDARLLPVQLSPGARIAVIMPQPQDLTPADTSSYESPCLASALRAYHQQVDEFVTAHEPQEAEIAAFREKAAGYDLLVVATLSASLQPAQATLVRQLLALDRPIITVAARTPYDLAAYPEAKTHLCTYSIQEPSMKALAAAIWGQIPLRGKLPVTIPKLYSFGHGLAL